MTTYVADRVWDGVAGASIGRGFVTVTNGTIEAFGRAADLPEGSEVTDLGDATLMPGLINAHVHITFDASPQVFETHLAAREAGFDTLYELGRANLLDSVRGGVTTVRDLGTQNDVVFAAQAAVRDGSLVGSDIVAAGEGLTSVGGHCWFFGVECAGEDALRAAVRRQHDAGADVIKVFATGGNLTPNTDPFAPQFSEDELRAVVDEARGFSLPVAAHAHAPEGIRRAVAARVNTIEHCTFETPDGLAFDERAAVQMAEHGVVAVPTPGASILAFIADPSLIEQLPEPGRSVVRRIASKIPEISKYFQRMRDLGVQIITGTDAGIPNRPFGDFAADLVVYAGSDIGFGLGTRGTLVAATSGCAAALGLDDRGVLAPGKRADVIAVEGDPLTNLTDLQRTKLVLVAGRSAL